MDASLPTAAALAIAGDQVVGGVGTHEWALPTPDRVDLRGRCVLPGFTDAHVHFPTWALARARCGSRASRRSTRRSTASRAAPAAPARGCAAAAGATPSGPERADPPRRSTTPGRHAGRALSQDYHSLWLSAGARPRGRRPRGARRRRRARRGRRADRHPARGGGVAVPGALRHGLARTSASTAMRDGLQASRPRAASARSTTRTAGSARSIFGSGSPRRRADAARLAVAPARARRRARGARPALAARRRPCSGSAT